MKNQTPPLKIWAWVGFLFILSQFLILAFYSFKKLKSGPLIHYPKKSLIQEEFKQVDKINVVAIGSSLFGYGVLSRPNDIEALQSSTSAPKINLIKYWGSKDPFERLINQNLVQDLISLKPDLVIIQTELAAINLIYEVVIDHTPLRRISLMNRAVLRYFLEKQISTNVDDLLHGQSIVVMDNLELDTLNYTPRPREVKSVNEIEIVLEMLAKLQKEGVKTIIVDIPRPKRTEKVINTPKFKQELHEVLCFYESKFGVQYWSYDGETIHFKYFRDYGHLNVEGGKIYTKWLMDKISKEF